MGEGGDSTGFVEEQYAFPARQPSLHILNWDTLVSRKHFDFLNTMNRLCSAGDTESKKEWDVLISLQDAWNYKW